MEPLRAGSVLHGKMEWATGRSGVASFQVFFGDMWRVCPTYSCHGSSAVLVRSCTELTFQESYLLHTTWKDA